MAPSPRLLTVGGPALPVSLIFYEFRLHLNVLSREDRPNLLDAPTHSESLLGTSEAFTTWPR